MNENFLSILGIVLSIAFFSIGYKQTVGAKKERIKNANLEILNIIIRRIIDEGYKLEIIDIQRLIEGKSRDFKVRVNDLLSDKELLNNVYIKVIETDFLNIDQREGVLNKILPLINQIENDEQKSLQSDELSDFTKYNLNSLIPLAVTSITVGSSFMLLLDSGEKIIDQGILHNILFPTVSISLFAITFFIIVKIIKEYQEADDLSWINSLRIKKFEEKVRKVLDSSIKGDIELLPNKPYYDYAIKKEDKIILFEIEYFTSKLNQHKQKIKLFRLQAKIEVETASELVLVVNKKIYYTIPTPSYIKVLTINELKEYIKNL